MKKILLIGMIGLVAMSFDVGRASNASITHKTAEEFVLSDINDFDLVIINTQINLNYYRSLSLETLPVFVAPAPVTLPEPPYVGYAPYKENKVFKNKYHAEHLFNPLKLC